MSWFNKLERRLEPFAINNLTLYLVAGQTFVYLAEMFRLVDVRRWVLLPALVSQGEFWRLFTFVLIPPSAHWALIAFALWFLYFTGGALEDAWGAVRYNLFLLTGYVLTVSLAFVTPFAIATNVFIGGSIFLAFAYLNPNFEILLFLILPVKVKWLALLTWVGYAYSFATGGWGTRLAVVAGVGNFLIFFARDLVLDVRAGRRRANNRVRRAVESAERQPRHRCHVCGKTDLTNPEMDFRYCSKCSGDQCYCPEHIRNHEHVVTPPEEPR